MVRIQYIEFLFSGVSESECHKPFAPRNSQLMCNSVKGIQQCHITCDEHYQLSLADPVIKCTENAEEDKSAWTPFLGAGVCASKYDAHYLFKNEPQKRKQHNHSERVNNYRTMTLLFTYFFVTTRSLFFCFVCLSGVKPRELKFLLFFDNP